MLAPTEEASQKPHEPGIGCHVPEGGWQDWPGTDDWSEPPAISQEALAAVHDVYVTVASDAMADPERRAQAIRTVGLLRAYGDEWAEYAGLS